MADPVATTSHGREQVNCREPTITRSVFQVRTFGAFRYATTCLVRWVPCASGQKGAGYDQKNLPAHRATCNSACWLPTQPSNDLPAIEGPAGGERLAGKFVWFDLLTDDPSAARAFYGELFGWDMEGLQSDPAYTVIRHNGEAIAGISDYEDQDAEVFESVWLPSLSVSDVDQAIQIACTRGAEILYGPLDAGQRGRLAVVRDPAGAELAFLASSDGDPVDRARRIGEWAWVDLFTLDPVAAAEFYGDLVGYQLRQVQDQGQTVSVLVRDGVARAGIVELPWDDIRPNWLSYVRVDDLDVAIARARSLGGWLVLRLDDVAVLADPTGAAIGVQQIDTP